ncbi:MAG: hypothetical protein QM791_10420 [Ferruginibacter sp.]
MTNIYTFSVCAGHSVSATRKNLSRLFLLTGILLMSVCITQAQIATWNTFSASGTVAPGTWPVTTSSINLLASDISRGAGVTSAALANGFSGTDWVATTQANAQTANDYYQFSVVAQSGYKASLSSLSFKLRRSSTGANKYIWRYSLDGTNFTDITASLNTSYTSTATNGDAFGPVDLSTITALQNVVSTTTITFRLYAWGGSASTGSFAIGRSLSGTENSLVLNGTLSAVAPELTATPSLLTGFNYMFGLGPSAYQSFTLKGTSLAGPYPGTVTVTAPTDYEVSLSSGSGYGASVNVSYASANVLNTPIYVRLGAGRIVGTYDGQNITCSSPASGASDVSVVCNGSVSVLTNSSSDIVPVASSEAASISSTITTAPPLTSATGVQVWSFTVRDGGGAADADALPTIIKSISFTQEVASGNEVTSWSQAIKTISIFDGTTLVATGTVSATQIDFTGLTLTVPDNTSKTYTVRLSLNCGIGSANKDGDDFVFSITNANVTTDVAGTSSQKSGFTTINSTNTTNVIAVVGTKLIFSQQPQSNVALNGNFSPPVAVTVTDNCNNIDKDFVTPINITSTGTMISSPQTATPSNGIASFSGISFSATGTGLTLTATSGALTSLPSNTFNVNTSTVLGPGDLMIVGFDTYVSTGSDIVSIANFVPVQPGTSFTLANVVYDWKAGAGIKQDRWYSGNNNLTTPGSFTAGPALANFTYTGGSVIGAGSVICISLENSPVGRVTDITINGGTSALGSFTVTDADGNPAKSPSGVGTNVAFNTSQPDAMFLMQGVWSADLTDANSDKYRTFTGTVFGGIQTFGSFQPFNLAGNIGGARVSRIHPQMECVAISTAAAADGMWGYYSGTRTGTHRNLINAIASYAGANWTKGSSTSNGDNLGSTCSNTFTVTTNVSPGLWRGDLSTDWYDCHNWDDFTIPTLTTDVLITNSATNNAQINNNSTKAAQNSNAGNAKSVNIIGKQLILSYTGSAATNTLNIASDLTINNNNGLNMSDGTAGVDGTINIGGNWINNYSTGFAPGQSLINFNGSAAQTITNPEGETFYNLTNANTTGGLSLVTNTANTTVSNILSLSSTTFGINTNTLTLNGTVTGAGTITGSATSNLAIGGTAGGAMGTLRFTAGGQTLNYLTVNRTGAGASATLGTNLSISNLATITAGVFNTDVYTFGGAGGLTMTGGELQLGKTGTLPELTGDYLLTGGTVNFTGTGAQTIKAVNYYNLTSSAAAGRTLQNNVTTGIANIFTPGASTYTVGTSIVDFNGLNTAQTIPAFNFYSVGFKNGGTKTLGGDISVSKTLTMGENTIFAVSANNVTLKSISSLTANVTTVPSSATIDQGGAGRFVIERYIDPLRSWRLLTAPITTSQTIHQAWQENSARSVTGVQNPDNNPGYGTHITGPSPSATNGFDESPQNNYSIKKWDGSAWTGTGILTPTTDVNSESGWMLFVRGNRSYNIGTTTQYTTPFIATLRTTGRINVGDMAPISLPVTPSGFSVVGNPYPSAINFSSIAKSGPGDIYYIWDPKINSGKYETAVGGWIAMSRLCR